MLVVVGSWKLEVGGWRLECWNVGIVGWSWMTLERNWSARPKGGLTNSGNEELSDKVKPGVLDMGHAEDKVVRFITGKKYLIIRTIFFRRLKTDDRAHK
jgi:hypothetical protein